jgi:hypothetical protein
MEHWEAQAGSVHELLAGILDLPFAWGAEGVYPANIESGNLCQQVGYSSALLRCKTRKKNFLRLRAFFSPPLWDTDACARPALFSTKQKCKAKVKEESSSVTCHRRLSLQ